MRTLLEMKELGKRFYSRYEAFIVPVLRFLLAFFTLTGINGQLGFMTRINSTAIVLMVSLLCSFLPNGFIIVFAALFVLLHFYALAIEVALVGFCLFLVMLLLFFRFTPRDSVVVILTPLCFGLHIPYVMPLAMGLLGTPASAVSVGCGVIVYYLIHFVSQSASSINAMDAGEALVRLRMVIDSILSNKEMLVVVAAFVFTVVLVYLIRRMSIDHAWTIAMVAGTIMDIAILLVGDLMYDTNVSVLGVILGSIVSLGLAAVLQFFVFSVDYSRTEKVQFEDDEYYYYVKAVPKMTVAAPEKTVKKINSQMGRQVHTAGVHQPERHTQRTAGRPGNGQYPSGRQTASRTIAPQHERTYSRRDAEIEDIPDDYEEL